MRNHEEANRTEGSMTEIRSPSVAAGPRKRLARVLRLELPMRVPARATRPSLG